MGRVGGREPPPHLQGEWSLSSQNSRSQYPATHARTEWHTASILEGSFNRVKGKPLASMVSRQVPSPLLASSSSPGTSVTALSWVGRLWSLCQQVGGSTRPLLAKRGMQKSRAC